MIINSLLHPNSSCVEWYHICYAFATIELEKLEAVKNL
jgi:hypothetical protein